MRIILVLLLMVNCQLGHPKKRASSGVSPNSFFFMERIRPESYGFNLAWKFCKTWFRGQERKVPQGRNFVDAMKLMADLVAKAGSYNALMKNGLHDSTPNRKRFDLHSLKSTPSMKWTKKDNNISTIISRLSTFFLSTVIKCCFN